MTNLIYRCGQSGHFFLNLSTFFQFSKRGRERLPLPPSTCAPVYYKIKEKTEEKRSWKCLRLPFMLQGKAFFKKISWSKISQLVIFFFQLYKNEAIRRYFSRSLTRYTARTFTEQLFSGTAILTENFRWLLLELPKFSNYSLEA